MLEGDFLKFEQYDNYVKKVYQKLHKVPETGFKEFATSDFIDKELRKIGFEVFRINGSTGLIGMLDSGIEGLNFGLRADIDALEFGYGKNKTNVHACGHDANSAMVLATAREVAKKGISKGKLILIFQPAEEILLGAKKVIKSGLIDELDELVGIHLRPADELKLGEATPSLRHGASYIIGFDIEGKNSHAARPHLGVNVLDAIVLAANGINMLKFDPKISHSIKITKVCVDNDTYNTIPNNAKVTLDLRAQTNELMDEILNKVIEVFRNMSELVGAKATVSFTKDSPAAEYDPELVADVGIAITKVLGCSTETLRTPGSEDFHYYPKHLKVKTAYIGLGANLVPGLHHPDMTFDKKSLMLGVNILKEIVFKKLS